MMQVFEELSANELLTLSVGDMAHKFSCSRRHLNRLFHQHFGCSVASLRMEMRLLKALSLLRDRGVKIIHVAEQCGFNHLGLFNACFKKRFGNTPTQWRKGASNGESPGPDLKAGPQTCPMRDSGLCPLAPRLDARPGRSQEAFPPQMSSRSSAPSDSKLRKMIVEDIRQVSAQMKMNCKSSDGLLLRSAP